MENKYVARDTVYRIAHCCYMCQASWWLINIFLTDLNINLI